eukprot:9068235-Pyramimonas_sp.AAC.1
MHEARAEFHKRLRSRLAESGHEYLRWCIAALRGFRASVAHFAPRAERAQFDPHGLHALTATLNDPLVDSEEDASRQAGGLSEHEVPRRRARVQRDRQRWCSLNKSVCLGTILAESKGAPRAPLQRAGAELARHWGAV